MIKIVYYKGVGRNIEFQKVCNENLNILHRSLGKPAFFDCMGMTEYYINGLFIKVQIIND